MNKITFKNPNSYFFLESVEKTIISEQMLYPGEKVLVAVSGGSDSVALFHVLRLLSDKFRINISIAHVNHNLREEDSKRDSLFVASLANEFKIPFYSISANVLKLKKKLKLSLEEAARKIRYSYFKKLIIDHSFSKVSLGHHMDDNAELILMFMIRGSGFKGISGMLPIRDKCYIRPFIKVKKEQIVKFIIDEKFNYVEDKSNNSLKFTRNTIRHYLIPIIKKNFNPGIIDTLNRTSVLINSENKWMDEVTTAEYEKVTIKSDFKNRILFSIYLFNKLNISLKRRIIRKAIFILTGSLKRITFNHVDMIMKLSKSNSGVKWLHLPNHLKAFKSYDKLEITNIENFSYKKFVQYSESISNLIIKDKRFLPQSFQTKNYKFKFSVVKLLELPLWNNVGKNTAFIDLNLVIFPISLHYAMAKNSFNPLGMYGHQKLKKYFINKKIPVHKRQDLLVIKDKNRIVWLVGHTICNYTKVTKTTKDVLKIEFYLLKTQK